MEDTTTLNLRRIQYLEAYVLIERIIALAVAGWRGTARVFAAISERQQRARARLEMHQLSDHVLRDIGIERGQIERLFR